jgi:hypothetical protein
MALDILRYDVWPFTRDLDQLSNLFYVERLVVEADTDDELVTASFVFEDATVTPATASNSSRGMLNFDVNRLGPLHYLTLSPAADIQWYGIELFIRPVVLGINIVESGQRVAMPGRTNDASTSIRFDINPFSFPADARHVNPIVRRIFVDIETGDNTVTPSLLLDSGSTVALTAITEATRTIVELNVLQARRVKAVILTGDFADGEVILYDLEADVYLPSARRMALG